MEPHAQRRRLIPAAVLVVGLVCTLLASLQFSRSHHRAERDRLARSVVRTQSRIAERMAACTAMLRATAGLFAASDYVEAKEFHEFVAQLRLESSYPGIGGIGYSERADPESLQGHIDREQGPGYALRPAGEDADHFAVVYIEPLDDENRPAIGYDMFADPDRRAAMECACESGDPIASAPVMPIQHGATSSVGFIIYFPLYTGGDIPDSIEARQQKLAGFVHISIVADELLGGLFPENQPPAEFAIYDGAPSDPASLLYKSPSFEPALARIAGSDMLSTSVLSIAGRDWTLLVAPGAAFDAGSSTGLAPVVAGAGALISLLLFGLARVQLRAAERSERTASELRESEARKGAILESALDAVITTDHEGRILEWNPAAERIFGRPAAAAVGHLLADLISPGPERSAHQRSVAEFLQPVRATLIGTRTETVALRADGSEFPVELSLCRIGAADPPRFTCFVRDISDRVRAERHQAFMTRELDHRVKNNLATVIAILGESARRSQSIDDLVRNASGRIRALASLHEMLAARNWQGAEIGELVSRTLAPYKAEGRTRVVTQGSALTLPGRAASSLCMALHELATNASKYGALSAADGTVSVSWHAEDRAANGHWLVITWQEHGGPIVQPPAQRGFGSGLIEDGVVFEAGGASHLEFAPTGVVCRIEVPLPNDAPEAADIAAP